MRLGNSRKRENSKDSEAAFGSCDVLDEGGKKWGGVLDFRSETGQRTGS